MDKDANYDELKKGNTVKIAGVLDDYSDNKQGININMINGTRKQISTFFLLNKQKFTSFVISVIIKAS